MPPPLAAGPVGWPVRAADNGDHPGIPPSAVCGPSGHQQGASRGPDRGPTPLRHGSAMADPSAQAAPSAAQGLNDGVCGDVAG